jgi:hypothetical protein
VTVHNKHVKDWAYASLFIAGMLLVVYIYRKCVEGLKSNVRHRNAQVQVILKKIIKCIEGNPKSITENFKTAKTSDNSRHSS